MNWPADDRAGELPGAVAQFVTAEHFGLQGARAATVTETNGRLQAYLSLISAVVVALAFIAQVTEFGSPFFAFALVLLPLVYFVGLATIARVQQIWGEWMLYQVGISRLRRFYLEIEPRLEPYIVLPTSDDPAQNLASIGISLSPWRWMLGVTGMVGVVNSVVAGVLVGFIARQMLAPPPAVAWTGGTLGFVLSVVLLRTMMLRSQRTIEDHLSSLVPPDH